jgi:hypothetical protein
MARLTASQNAVNCLLQRWTLPAVANFRLDPAEFQSSTLALSQPPHSRGGSPGLASD